MARRLTYLFSLLMLAIAAPAFADTVTDSGSGGTISNDVPGTGSIASTITITDAKIIQNARFGIQDLSHEWVGDLIATVTHEDPTGDIQDATLFFRTGKAQSSGDGDSSDLVGDYVFRDDVTNDWWSAAGSGGNDSDVIPVGNYRASGMFGGFVDLDTIFAGRTTEGDWTLEISDLSEEHGGSFSGWNVELITAVPEPTSALAIFGAGALFLRRRRVA
jgi:subtilisin-like proprotein convertase family protein